MTKIDFEKYYKRVEDCKSNKGNETVYEYFIYHILFKECLQYKVNKNLFKQKGIIDGEKPDLTLEKGKTKVFIEIKEPTKFSSETLIEYGLNQAAKYCKTEKQKYAYITDSLNWYLIEVHNIYNRYSILWYHKSTLRSKHADLFLKQLSSITRIEQFGEFAKATVSKYGYPNLAIRALDMSKKAFLTDIKSKVRCKYYNDFGFILWEEIKQYILRENNLYYSTKTNNDIDFSKK